MVDYLFTISNLALLCKEERSFKVCMITHIARCNTGECGIIFKTGSCSSRSLNASSNRWFIFRDV